MKLYLLLLTALCISSQSDSKEIAITFDDSPRQAEGYFNGPQRAKKLIEELKSHDVAQVVFFSNSQALDVQRLGGEGRQRLKTYGEAGHIIANHTDTHPNFNEISLEEYVQDFLSAGEKLSQFKNFKKLFRFPYLREGDTREKRDGMRDMLNKLGYTNAYITLNNYDWYIESLFQNAIKKGVSIDFDRLRQFYVEVIMESIVYYDQMAQTHLGRSPKHVLLLHEMDISALFIGDLVDELRRQGWKIISPEQAYTDEIVEYQTEQLFPYNPGRIGEIARDKGQTKGLWHKTLNEKYLERRFAEKVLNVSSNNQ